MQRRASTSRRSGPPGSAAAARLRRRPRHGHHDRVEPRRDGGAGHPGGAGPRGATSPVTAAVCDGGVWLANTVSPLLPVPDLTNSLAVGRLELPVTAYARMMLFAGAAPACLLLVRRCWPGRRWSSPPRVRRYWSRQCACGAAVALVPWRLALLVEGLFLVVHGIGPHELDTLLRYGLGARLQSAAVAAMGATSSRTCRPIWRTTNCSRCCSG